MDIQTGANFSIRYFDFHPAPTTESVSSKTHGLIPVWGFGTVVNSTHPHIQTGERVYGYLAPTRYLLVPVSPSDVNRYSFFVPRPHLPAGSVTSSLLLFKFDPCCPSDRRPYNQIIRCFSDPHYDPSPAIEDLTMLYRPLFWTSYWCEDWLFSSQYRGGKSFLISSASSKTAFCLAYLIGKRVARGELSNVQIVGLTSKKNLAFTKGLSLYDEVLDYDTFASASSFAPNQGSNKWLYADVAGNDNLNDRVFAHFGSRLVASISLGLTNLSPSSADASSTKWSTNTVTENPAASSSASPTTFEQFFMPEWLAVRRRQLSIAQITSLQSQAWKDLMKDCGSWVKMVHVFGVEEVKTAYQNIAKSGLGPDRGLIWSMWEKWHGNNEPTSRL